MKLTKTKTLSVSLKLFKTITKLKVLEARRTIKCSHY